MTRDERLVLCYTAKLLTSIYNGPEWEIKDKLKELVDKMLAEAMRNL